MGERGRRSRPDDEPAPAPYRRGRSLHVRLAVAAQLGLRGAAVGTPGQAFRHPTVASASRGRLPGSVLLGRRWAKLSAEDEVSMTGGVGQRGHVGRARRLFLSAKFPAGRRVRLIFAGGAGLGRLPAPIHDLAGGRADSWPPIRPWPPTWVRAAFPLGTSASRRPRPRPTSRRTMTNANDWPCPVWSSGFGPRAPDDRGDFGTLGGWTTSADSTSVGEFRWAGREVSMESCGPRYRAAQQMSASRSFLRRRRRAGEVEPRRTGDPVRLLVEIRCRPDRAGHRATDSVEDPSRVGRPPRSARLAGSCRRKPRR